jgi:hypothetical protein
MFQYEHLQLTETERWYVRAKEKVEKFLREVDPDLSVEIVHAGVMPDSEDGEPFETLALEFKSASDPDFGWTMGIQESQAYIDQKLEEVVRSIYAKKRSRR